MSTSSSSTTSSLFKPFELVLVPLAIPLGHLVSSHNPSYHTLDQCFIPGTIQHVTSTPIHLPPTPPYNHPLLDRLQIFDTYHFSVDRHYTVVQLLGFESITITIAHARLTPFGLIDRVPKRKSLVEHEKARVRLNQAYEEAKQNGSSDGEIESAQVAYAIQLAWEQALVSGVFMQ